MKLARRVWVVFSAGCLMASTALGQDSVSKSLCLPGDAVSPWDLSEQCNDYIVDMSAFTDSWGTEFGIAPVLKTSKAASGFFGSLLSSQTMSRRQLLATPFPASSYDVWTSRGFGINNNPAVNDPGTPVAASGNSNQFAVAGAEFATTDGPASYNAIVGALVNYKPSEPSRLYVHRVAAALNSCDNSSNLSQFGLGSVDASGTIAVRADGLGTAADCGLNPLSGDNIFLIDMAGRDCGALNVVSNDFLGGGMFDSTPQWLVRNSAVVHSTPGLLQAAGPVYIGANFDSFYVRGSTFPVSADATQFGATGVDSQRGNISYTTRDCSQLASTAGMAAMLASEPSDSNLLNEILVFGLDASGEVTGSISLEVPTATIMDPGTGFIPLPGDHEFTNYESQAAFRGGNGQVALGVDPDGNLLAAAVMQHPADGGDNWPINYIPVARMSCATGDVEWSIIAYNDGSIGELGGGKPILDGPGGNVIGRMVTLDNVTGGTPFGPSISPPMFDYAGNAYFISAVELFNPKSEDGVPGSIFNSALIRAVYDPATFTYELALMMKLGDVFTGLNSGLTYGLSFMGVADNNSINSGTAFSQNISEEPHLGTPPKGAAPVDPQNLGGLMLGVEVTYDSDTVPNGEHDDCLEGPPFGDPGDQPYNVLLYIGSLVPGGEAPCVAVSECADQDSNNQRDDECVWTDCDAGTCIFTDIVFADMGGSFGACAPDGFTNLFDRTHALTCFAGTNTCSPFNADAGGAFGGCNPDGFCNLFDATHALTAFAGTNACTCPSNPAPAAEPRVVGGSGLTVKPAASVIRPGQTVQVRVYLDEPLKDLQGYQLHLGTSGGRRGALELVDITVEPLKNAALAGQAETFQAFNTSRGQMLASLEAGGVSTSGGAYLATFTYQASADAAGTFVIDVLHDSASSHQTYLVSNFVDQVLVEKTRAAAITVADMAARSSR